MKYNWFAKVYDELMDDTLYPKWATYTGQHLTGQDHILELGCGTGILATELTKAGFDITGLDLSSDMLSLAYDRQIDTGIQYPLVEMDMKDFSELGKFDGILCYSDALCYIQSEEEKKQIFQEVYNQLTEEGTFLFDVHSIYQIEQFKQFSYHDEVNQIVFLWDSFEGEQDYSIEHQLTFFVENENETYERFEEVHREWTHPLETYIDLLKSVGFKNIEVTADFGGTVSDTSKRWFFAAKK
ncbi:class I SAM-dependent methyltransferase [Marinilactibacillus sp. Marseille-P9653]|uniref:class I SAM-dependent DNA methyltransferase n=1 Tax=Marinilactibacillus sp. Marseille-P9653 TaxID=2866583 RepID=UPI001CE3B602|nr:class I SAM-dependent methyltransferase [Marinilactibacillus sp. Marseille-P9653]